MYSQIKINHRQARAYALVLTGSMIKDAEGHYERVGMEYHPRLVGDPLQNGTNDPVCGCPEFLKNAQTEAALEKYEADLATATTPAHKQGIARMIGSLLLNYPGPGCLHLEAMRHLEGLIDLKQELAALSKEPAEGYFQWIKGKDGKPRKALNKDGKPVLISPHADAVAICRAEKAEDELILAKLAEKQEAETRIERLDLRVPLLKVTGRRIPRQEPRIVAGHPVYFDQYQVEDYHKKLRDFFSWSWPQDEEGQFLPEKEAFELAACVWDPAHYSFSKVMVDLPVAANAQTFC